MMKYQNDGSDTFSLQNQFTAFVQTAIYRTRNRYITAMMRRQNAETLVSFNEEGIFPETTGENAFFYFLSNCDDFQNEFERHVFVTDLLRHLTAQQRLILKLRIFDDMSFKAISAVLRKNENTVKAVYYATLRKLSQLVGGKDEWNF